MSNRSVYPEGVEVHQLHLANTEAQRTAADKQILADITTRGVQSGLGVTVSVAPNDTKVNIASGSAYAPNGEFMTLAVGQNAVALADYTLGTKNYMLLVYDETQSKPESHESDGTTRQTIASVTPRITALTEAAYNALSLNDAVLSNNDRNRACILAIVTANGVGIPLTAGSIQLPTVYQAVLQSNQPANITGVIIISIDSNTPVGNGVLAWTFGTSSITWKAPGEGSFGAPTVITSSGAYFIISSGGKTLELNIAASELPSTNQNDTLSIVNIYSEAIPRHSAEDFQHRTMVGAGVPTPRNPHGLTLGDLASGVGDSVEEHQDIMHANGIAKLSSPTLLSAVVNSGPAPDTVTVSNFSPGDYVFINGKRVQALTNSNVVTFTSVVSNNQGLYGIWLGQDGNLFKQVRAQYPVGSLLEFKTQIINVVGFTGGTTNLTWDTGGILEFAAGPGQAAPPVDSIIRLYGLDRVSYIDLWVKGAQPPPGVTQTDAITLTAEPVLEENVPVCNVPFSGASTGFTGYGYGPAASPNGVFDRRIFGTLDESNVRTDSGLTDSAAAVDELLGNGIFVRGNSQPGDNGDNNVAIVDAIADQFSLGTLAFPNILMAGGVVYIKGHRFEIPALSLSMQDNITNRIFITDKGVVETSTLSWELIIANKLGHRILRLYDEVILAGAETGRTDYREYVGQRRDTAMGVVALNKYKQATIASTGSGAGGSAYTLVVSAGITNTSGLISTGNGTGMGIWGQGSGAPGSHAVVGRVAFGSAFGVYGFGDGLSADAGVCGVGEFGEQFVSVPLAGAGVIGKGSFIAPGGSFEGGGTNGDGVYSRGFGTGAGVHAYSNVAGPGVYSEAHGGGPGATIDAYGGSLGVLSTTQTGSGHAVSAIVAAALSVADAVRGEITSATGSGAGVHGIGGPTNASYGVLGEGHALAGDGVRGQGGAFTDSCGVHGISSNSLRAHGVYGEHTGTNSSTYAVYGKVTQGACTAVYGESTASFQGVGVFGKCVSTTGNGAGVRGQGGALNGTAGVEGISGSGAGNGVQGLLTGASTGAAVLGSASSASGFGGRFANSSGIGLKAVGPSGGTPSHGSFHMDTQSAQPTGTNTVGDFYLDSSAILWVCTAGGSPGTWQKVGSQ